MIKEIKKEIDIITEDRAISQKNFSENSHNKDIALIWAKDRDKADRELERLYKQLNELERQLLD